VLSRIAEKLVEINGTDFLRNGIRREGITREEFVERFNAKKQSVSMLYIHIPFCRSLCPFCSFNRYFYQEPLLVSYFESLKQELNIYKDIGIGFRRVYIGGGTPTVNFPQLISLIDFLKSEFQIQEISLESTPRELSEEKLEELKKKGVSRLSIGIQTLDRVLLKKIGRGWQDPESTLEIAKIANEKIPTLAADLIFNFPEQQVSQFENDLSLLMSTGISQITAYPLMPSIYSQEFKRIDRNRERQFYSALAKEAEKHDYVPSTVWCYSKQRQAPAHNIIDEYITNEDQYIGAGSSSISYVNGKISINTFALKKYKEMLEKGLIPVVFEKQLSNMQQSGLLLLNKLFSTKMQEEVVENIEKEGIHVKLLLSLLRLAGIVGIENTTWVLKRKGYYAVGSAMRMFFSVLNTLREDFRKRQV